jgi:RNA recognition motif-containing protein
MLEEGNNSQEPTCSIYLGNVPWKATPEEIAEAICSKTNVRVKDVRIVKEKGTGRSRGFAFVDLYHDNAERFISQTPELVLGGRTLTIKYANERKPQEVLSPVSIGQARKHPEVVEENVYSGQFAV